MADWDKLSILKEILEVRVLNLGLNVYKESFQMPHAYQQVLSFEKTPTLCKALPTFEGLVTKLKKYQHEHDDNPDIYYIVQCGITKLEEYWQETDTAPAYTLSISK